MKTRPTAPPRFTRRIITASLLLASLPALADGVYQTLPFSQNWSNIGLITTSDNWDGVPGILGYRGDDLTGSTGTDPQGIVAPGSMVLDINANQTAPNTFSTGGVAEFHLTDPTIALTGSGTADAPFILLHLNTAGFQNIQVAYTVRDLDASADNAVQQVALQYRIGNSGNFVNVPAAYVADATEAGTASKTTPVAVTLPAAADNQAQLQLRIITSNAVGNDEWVGIDDIAVSGSSLGAVNQPIMPTCLAGSVNQGSAGNFPLSASDADSRVNAASLAAGTPAGFSLSGLVAAGADGGTATVTLNVASSVGAGNYAVVVNFANDETQTASCTVDIAVAGLTPIYSIQGNGPSSPFAGQSVTTQGVVTKINNSGFFMQDASGDDDETTSDGIFVYTGSLPTVSLGDLVRVAATVSEFAVGSGAVAVANPLTELTSPTVSVQSAGHTITPRTITLPEAVEGDLERYEGMLVHIDNTLTVSQNYFLGRYGQLTLAAGGRLEKPTNRYPAGSAEAIAMADENARRRILLDDGSSLQNVNPTPYLAADNTVRAGDTINGITGVIDYGLATSDTAGLSDFRIHPSVAPTITRANPRTAVPDAVGGNIKVASFNVLNYFTTIDQSGASCYPGGTRSDCRGADSAAEFARQKAKIVNAIKALNGDVVGLMEIENNGNTAVLDLVAALNAAMGAGTYASVALPSGGSGTDAIRVAMIYKPAKLSPVGGAVSDTNAIHNRPPLVQTFAAANGEKFSVVVNHFKSKSSCPTSGSDTDQGDGQGCWNTRRVEQAQALRSYIQGLQASSGDADVIVIGDLNAYGKEDPILDFTANGYVDQVARFENLGYSYVFDGESGYLDHALATPSLSAQIAGAAHWRINADEPAIIDYNLEFKQPACATCGPDYYTSTAYRSSDHDPVVIGLNLLKSISGTAGRDSLVGSAGDDVISGGIGADTLTGGAGADQFVFASLRDGTDTITDFQPGIDRIVLTQVLQSAGIGSNAPLADGYVTCKVTGSDALIGIDTDGAGPTASRSLVLLKNQSCAVAIPGNFVF
ncbi:ExeM/NucH family extracellular endonuclease [Dechloromonas denitrificans]|uniref:ExeM/NucH family extracellular endonuclease n=1 Tax=Dechloromonas denitrificans TaxID=281362 RepID=UPI001CF9478B|nr:ExeM/NucH family extracellular endonuclease [Dechloromonas denitrificans]UCV09777.1 ExeM/NucH family extracellular endonuclease [Dechloromonas denitrificans]